MDRLDAMAVLVAAVEAGSLSAASRRLGTPLATVSRKVSELEAHLKTRLLNRSSRKLSLTDAGAAYVAACKRILDDVSEAERDASGEYSSPKGSLIVTAPIFFGRLHVLPIVVAFLKAYPDIDIRLVLTDVVANLLEQNVDLAVRIAMLPDSSLVATRVGSIRRVVCASPAYLAAHGTPKVPDDLSAHDCIVRDSQFVASAWSFTTGGSETAVPIRARLTVNTAETTIDAAVAGLGVTRAFSYQIADAVRAGSLIAVLEEFEPEPFPVSLVYTAQGPLPIKLRGFIDFAAPRLKATFAAMAS
ncbi:MAG: LysR family transcriptional regulator [Pseudolabrys sp.]